MPAERDALTACACMLPCLVLFWYLVHLQLATDCPAFLINLVWKDCCFQDAPCIPFATVYVLWTVLDAAALTAAEQLQLNKAIQCFP